jgi:hypothetical protein
MLQNTDLPTRTTMIDLYLDAYGEPDPVRRRALIERCFDADAVLADPPMDAVGHDALDGMFAAVQGQFPGHRFERTSGVDAHHDAARYEWRLSAPDGTAVLAGTDVVRFTPTDTIASVVGFFGPTPPLDAAG